MRPPRGTRAERGDRWLVRGRLAEDRRSGGPLLFLSGGAPTAHLLSRGASWSLPAGKLLDRAVGALQGNFRRTIDLHASDEVNGLFKALALGDRSGIPPGLREVFARTGTSHLLAISGLHVGLLAGVVLAGVRLILRSVLWALWRSGAERGWGRSLPILAGVAVAGSYVLVAGAPVSGRRALAMLAVVAVASLAHRRASGWNVLAAAALLVLFFDPDALRQLGFQLSVVSVASLVATSPSGPSRLPRSSPPVRFIAGALRASAATALATGPLCALVWGRVPLAGLWVNVPAIFLLGVATVPLVLLGSVLGLVSDALAAPVLALAALPASLGLDLVSWSAASSRSPVILWSPEPRTVILLYLSAGILVALWRSRLVAPGPASAGA